jgi:outer membrane biosynthesis protein TonB
MGRLSAPTTAFLLALTAAAVLAACGSEDAELLPGRTASEINSNLDEVQRRVAEGDCSGAEEAVATVRAEIAELGGVDRKLKENLAEGADRLDEVVVECQESEPEEVEATAEPTVEPEEAETEEKPKKEKPEKEREDAQEEAAEEPEVQEQGQELPPPASEKAEEKAGGESSPPVQPTEPTAPSGGVGPSEGVG